MAKKTAKKTARKTAKKPAKKTTKKKVARKTTKKAGRSTAKKYTFLDDLHARVLEVAEITRQGDVRIKRTDMKAALEEAFTEAAVQAAGGERVRFPVIGALVRKEVKAVKGGTKYLDPFTKEEKIRKARAASKKPRWSFPKAAKEIFSNKRYW